MTPEQRALWLREAQAHIDGWEHEGKVPGVRNVIVQSHRVLAALARIDALEKEIEISTAEGISTPCACRWRETAQDVTLLQECIVHRHLRERVERKYETEVVRREQAESRIATLEAEVTKLRGACVMAVYVGGDSVERAIDNVLEGRDDA